MQLSSAEKNDSAGLLAGKVVVVTGGAGLLGQAFCRSIAEHGGLPVIADIDAERGEKALAALQKLPEYRDGAFVQMNIGEFVSVRDGLLSVRKRFGRIDAVVNNAYPRNARYGGKFEDVTYADFCENVSLHTGGYFLVAQQAAMIFREQRHGNIINMGSVYGTLAPRFEIYDRTSMTMPVEYAVIKAGVLQLTRYLAKYLRNDGIRVNAISPGGISDHQPSSFLESYRKFCGEKGMLDANDICGALLFLLSDFSKYMNGQNLLVDDGFSL
jgi:NAD(P)-dependent dehydrogenase (short-subunit alcohol dehydrogenase family)